MVLFSKKWFQFSLLSLLLSILVVPANAQGELELYGFYGWQFWGTQQSREGELRIKAASDFGGALSYEVQPHVRGEFTYIRQPTSVEIRRFTGFTEDLFDMAVEYYMLGGVYEVPSGRGRIVPFASFQVGLAHFNPKPQNFSSEWRLAFGLSGGLKLFLTKRIGLRGDFRFLMPVQWAGGGIFCGGGGCNVGVTTGSTLIQGAVNGGVMIAF